VKAIKGLDLYDPVQVVEMCLVPNVIVPKNFHVPKLIKYTKTLCLITHFKSYCNKMVKVMHVEKLLIHFFQDSLSGVTLN